MLALAVFISWQQVEEALAVNSGQKLVCDFEMKNNAVMSYDVRSPES